MSNRWRSLHLVVLAVAVGAVVLASRRTDTGPRRRFPVQQLSPGDVPALWMFGRAECPSCRRHVAGLQTALAALDSIQRQRALARVHVVGDVPCTSIVYRHPRRWLRRLGIESTPLTWWVAADSSIARAWLGPRDAASWKQALAFVTGGVP